MQKMNILMVVDKDNFFLAGIYKVPLKKNRSLAYGKELLGHPNVLLSLPHTLTPCINEYIILLFSN